jgi:hypothetical protein
MTSNIDEILANIAEEHKENIDNDSRYYLEVSIAQKAAELGFSKAEARFRNAYAIVPLKSPVDGMKVRIDGRTFVNYAQFESGIVVPNYVAGQVDLPHKAYAARDSMICIFTYPG